MEVDIIRAGDTVIVSTNASLKDLQPVVVTYGGELQNNSGFFPHSSIIGKPYGSKIESSSRTLKGSIHVLKLTPELWTLSLPHRTQILYHADISMVVSKLGLAPGCRVVESGTGSGSLTHALARAVAPNGHVFTFEFNAHRAKCAAEEFKAHGISDLMTVTHRDAVGVGFQPEVVDHSADGVFLDLPNPWGAVHHARAVLKPCGVLCSFSPCIEQISRTAREMERLGFEDVRCFETLLRPFDVREGRLAPVENLRLDITTAEQAKAAAEASHALRVGAAGAAPKQSASGAQLWQPKGKGKAGQAAKGKGGKGAAAAGAKPQPSPTASDAPSASAAGTDVETDASAVKGSSAAAPEATPRADVDVDETDQEEAGTEAEEDGSKPSKRARMAEGPDGADGLAHVPSGSLDSVMSAPDPDDPAWANAGAGGSAGVEVAAGSAGAAGSGSSAAQATGAAGASSTASAAAPVHVVKAWPTLDYGPVLIKPVTRVAGHTGYLLFGTLYRLELPAGVIANPAEAAQAQAQASAKATGKGSDAGAGAGASSSS